MVIKKSVSITIDPDLWDIAEKILPCSRSEFVENQLIEYIKSNTNSFVLTEEIDILQKVLINKKEQLQRFKEFEEREKEIRENK